LLAVQFDSLIGLTAEVSVSGVADQAGNKVHGTTMWSFDVADFDASGASVHVTGLLLNISSSSVDSAALAAIKTDLAALLGVGGSRFTDIQASEAWISGSSVTALEFIIKSSSKTATSVAQQLAQAVQSLASGSNALSSYSSALNTAVSSQV
jgi:hypothetical protein